MSGTSFRRPMPREVTPRTLPKGPTPGAAVTLPCGLRSSAPFPALGANKSEVRVTRSAVVVEIGAQHTALIRLVVPSVCYLVMPSHSQSRQV